MLRRLFFPVVLTIFTTASLLAGTKAPAKDSGASADSGRLSIERVFGDPAHPLGGRLERRVWRPKHDSWLVVRREGEGREAVQRLAEIDARGGTEEVVLAPDDLVVPGTEKAENGPSRFPLRGFTADPDGEHILLREGGSFWLASLEDRSIHRIDADTKDARVVHFSPDGQRLAFVRSNDLHVLDLATGRQTRLTNDGSDTVHNGLLDWIYWEELSERDPDAHVWSPDGHTIAWLRLDDSPITPFPIVDDLKTHATVREQRYPKAGDPSPLPSLHVARLDDTLHVTKTWTVTFTNPTPYVPRFGFTPDGKALWYQVLDRPQNRLRLMRMDLATGAAAPLLTETDPYWVEPVDMLRFFKDGSFLWASRRSGYMHLELHDARGKVRDLTPGPWVVTGLVGVDEAAGVIYYQAARPTPLERRIYAVRIAGGATRELTAEPGTHGAELSPGHGFLLVRSSAVGRPPHLELFSSEGKHLRTVDANEDAELAAMKLGATRFLTITARDGLELDAAVLTPPDFDPSRTYPAVVYVYGGPHAQVVKNAWGRSTYLFHQWLAQHGFVVFSVDNRGAAAHGRKLEGAADHRLGSSQLPDLLDGVAWLKKQPWIDGARVGVWGWSYGGYFTAYALTHAPGVFAAGVAVAPVTDWRLYDSTYTERYMGTPEENPEGYMGGSVLEAVAGLQDPLLIIHGTGDDNVHFQNTLQFAHRAWKAGKSFDLKLFPNLKHGIHAKGAHVQVFGAIGGFFLEHLGGNGAG